MKVQTFTRIPFMEAVRFEHPDDASAIAEWCGGTNERHPEEVDVPTPNGLVAARPGDYVLRGITGAFYVRNGKQFAATYIAADPGDSERIAEAVRRATESPGATIHVTGSSEGIGEMFARVVRDGGISFGGGQ